MNTIARALTVPALLLAAVGCSYTWSQSVEIDGVDVDLGAEPVMLDVLGTLTSDDGEELPCDGLEGSLTGIWAGDAVTLTVLRDGEDLGALTPDEGGRVSFGSLAVTTADDGACIVTAELQITADIEVSGSLGFELNLSDMSSGPDDDPKGDTTLTLDVAPAE